MISQITHKCDKEEVRGKNSIRTENNISETNINDKIIRTTIKCDPNDVNSVIFKFNIISTNRNKTAIAPI